MAIQHLFFIDLDASMTAPVNGSEPPATLMDFVKHGLVMFACAQNLFHPNSLFGIHGLIDFPIEQLPPTKFENFSPELQSLQAFREQNCSALDIRSVIEILQAAAASSSPDISHHRGTVIYARPHGLLPIVDETRSPSVLVGDRWTLDVVVLAAAPPHSLSTSSVVQSIAAARESIPGIVLPVALLDAEGRAAPHAQVLASLEACFCFLHADSSSRGALVHAVSCPAAPAAAWGADVQPRVVSKH